jgi:hypothetical protein
MKTAILLTLAVASLGTFMSLDTGDRFVPVAAAEARDLFGGDCVASKKLSCSNVPTPPQGCKRTVGQVTFCSGPTMDNAESVNCTADCSAIEGCGHVHLTRCDGTPFEY